MVQPRKIFQSSYKIKRRKFLDYINSRTFPGRKLPNESDLAKILEMSLGTVREILREMEMVGTITKMKGKGNFLNTSSQNLKMRIDMTKDFAVLLEGKGYEVNFKTFAIKEEVDSRLVALGRKFFPELVASGEYQLIGNVYYADATPAIFAAFMVPGLTRGANQSDDELIADYWNDYRAAFDHAGIKLEVGMVPEMASPHMELSTDVPIQMWNEVHYNKYDELLCCSYSYFNPDIMEMSLVRK